MHVVIFVIRFQFLQYISWIYTDVWYLFTWQYTIFWYLKKTMQSSFYS